MLVTYMIWNLIFSSLLSKESGIWGSLDVISVLFGLEWMGISWFFIIAHLTVSGGKVIDHISQRLVVCILAFGVPVWINLLYIVSHIALVHHAFIRIKSIKV